MSFIQQDAYKRTTKSVKARSGTNTSSAGSPIKFSLGKMFRIGSSGSKKEVTASDWIHDSFPIALHELIFFRFHLGFIHLIVSRLTVIDNTNHISFKVFQIFYLRSCDVLHKRLGKSTLMKKGEGSVLKQKVNALSFTGPKRKRSLPYQVHSIRESRDLLGHAPTAVWFKYMGCQLRFFTHPLYPVYQTNFTSLR